MNTKKKTRTGYVGAHYDWASDKVTVWERDEEGRKAVSFNAPKYFYVPDENGEFTSIYKDKLKRLDFDTNAEYKAALNQYRNKFESDIPPMFKVLMDEYYGAIPSKIHYAFCDVEWNYSAAQGWSSTKNPYAELNGVSIYQSWTNRFKLYAVPPKTLDFNKLSKMKFDFGDNVDHKLCRNEAELLQCLVNDIQQADIISGWNSEFADIPYIMKRIERVIPKLANKMSFIGCPPPKEGTTEKFGNEEVTYKLYGRSHIDYMDAFKKFTFEGRTSYSLENIANDELDIPKMHYDGTLEELYHGTHRPHVEATLWEETENMEQMMRLNYQRELIRKEIERRKLSI